MGAPSRRTPRWVVGLTTLAIVMATSIGLVVFGTPSQAQATYAGFQAGNIMSDAVMGNANTMSVAQIQAFLNSQNPCNKTVASGNSSGISVVVTSASSAYLSTNSSLTYQITGGVPGTNAGTFLCLKNSTFNGQSAAQIIYNTAQQYQINPQVLIVLLQKEEGLITDQSPNSGQYQIATGFGCPDTAPCNTAYYGFQNQLSQAANLFRTVLNGGWSNYPAYTTVYVQYNPNAACGGSNVYIANRATSALYRYTPYQPNAAVLAAQPGTVVNCGAYGNSNFYNLFTDWFGSTQLSIGGSPLCQFTDVLDSSPYAPYICWLASVGVTSGTSPTTYSPAAAVERQQMAVFLDKMAGSPSFTTPTVPSFTDVPTSSDYYPFVEWLKSTGITSGTSPTTFSPTSPVEREQMAVFLYKLAGSPQFTPPAVASFTDVPTSSDYYPFVEWLKSTGITSGTSPTTFNPNAPVTRDQMAVFLEKLADTHLYCGQYPAGILCGT